MIGTQLTRRSGKRQRGIALAIVLVLIMLMITAVYAFSRRAVINVHIAQNRLAASKADAAARGALRMAEAVVFMIRLEEQASAGGGGGLGANTPDASEALAALAGSNSVGGDVWTQFENFPIEIGAGQDVTIRIEELSGRLNINGLVAQSADPDTDPEDRADSPDSTESVEYLVLVLRHIIDGIDAAAQDKNYDERSIAENLIDYMDSDDTSLGGGSEDAYYQALEPPYSPRNGPFLSFEEIGMVEGVDPTLLEAMRHYLTIHPIGGSGGIDLNRAEPWVLPLVYAGPSGDRELIRDRTLRQLLEARKNKKKVCTDTSVSPSCVSLADVGIDEGSIFPESILPTPVSVFRVVAEAKVDSVSRRIEAIYDTRPTDRPQLLSWRRLRGVE